MESLSHSVEDPHAAAQGYSEEGGKTLSQKARERPRAKMNWASILGAVRITKGVSWPDFKILTLASMEKKYIGEKQKGYAEQPARSPLQ